MKECSTGIQMQKQPHLSHRRLLYPYFLLAELAPSLEFFSTKIFLKATHFVKYYFSLNWDTGFDIGSTIKLETWISFLLLSLNFFTE